MASVRDIAAYLCRHYPWKDELSKARLTKMIYLADWRSAIDRGKQVSEITWQFSHFGPYVPEVVERLRSDPAFSVKRTSTVVGNPKDLISYGGPDEFPSLSTDDREVLDFVISSVSPLTWHQFMKLVYSTYPVVSTPRYSQLDLIELARQYRLQEELLSRAEQT